MKTNTIKSAILAILAVLISATGATADGWLDYPQNIAVLGEGYFSVSPNINWVGSTFTVRVGLLNTGVSGFDASRLRIVASSDDRITTLDYRIGEVHVPMLWAGEYRQITVTCTVGREIPPGEYYVGAIADVYGTVPESDESDNIRVFTRPKLIVRNSKPHAPTAVSPANGATGVAIYPRLTASAFYDPNLGDRFQSSEWQISTSSTFSNPIILRPGAVSSVLVNQALMYGRRYYWRVRYTDSRGEIGHWSTPVWFTTPPATILGFTPLFATPLQPEGSSPSSGPDFVVTRITASPYPIRAGQSFSLYVTVRNQGNAAGDGGRLLVWRHKPDAAVCGETADGSITVGRLNPGESRQLVLTGSRVRVDRAGRYTARVFVDGNCETVETNESNNQFTQAYTVE